MSGKLTAGDLPFRMVRRLDILPSHKEGCQVSAQWMGQGLTASLTVTKGLLGLKKQWRLQPEAVMLLQVCLLLQ